MINEELISVYQLSVHHADCGVILANLRGTFWDPLGAARLGLARIGMTIYGWYFLVPNVLTEMQVSTLTYSFIEK